MSRRTRQTIMLSNVVVGVLDLLLGVVGTVLGRQPLGWALIISGAIVAASGALQLSMSRRL